MKIEEATRRLAFIKYLYDVGVDQSRRAEPFCWVSVLTFHDAVELFLELASEYLNVPKRVKELSFPKYWGIINPILKEKGQPELTQRITMDKLNENRIAFKHHGTPPSKLAIEESRVNATNFFEENASIIFDVKFSEVSLVNLIQCEDAKKSLMESQRLLKQNKRKDALDKIALAFAQLIDDYEMRKTDKFGRSPFFFGEKVSPIMEFPIGLSFEEMERALKPLQDAVKILSLGLDYRKYARFHVLTPVVIRFIGGKYSIQRIEIGRKISPTNEDVQFCIDFVIESAITLQEFDYNFESGK